MSSLDICLLLGRADAEVTRRFDGALALHGLGRTDYALLRELASGPLRRVDLARRLGVTPSGVTRMLHPLERIGLVERQPNPGDARAAMASLSPAGAALLDDATTTAERIADDVLTVLRSRDVDALQAALPRLIPAR